VGELAYARELYYRKSARTPAGRVVLVLLVAPLAAALIGALYAGLVFNVVRLHQILYVFGAAVVLLLAFSFGVAGATAGILRWLRVTSRIPTYAASVCAALSAWYASWVVWELLVLRRLGTAPAMVKFAIPPVVWLIARAINSVGTMSYGDRPVNGAQLWFIWAVEAAAVLFVGSWFPPRWLRSQALCESCGEWCKYREGFLSIGYGDEAALRAALENKDLAAVEALGAADMDAPHRFRLDLQQCQACGQSHLLSVHRIDVLGYTNSGQKKRARLLVDRLWLAPEQAAELKAIKDRLWPPIAEVAEAVDSDEAEEADSPVTRAE
jgi:hypothetical protein